jgi:signal peptidase I
VPEASLRALDRTRRAEALREANRRRRRTGVWPRGLRRASDWLVVLAAAVVLVLVLRAFVVEAFRIPSASMERTLLAGDFLLVHKWVYGAEVPMAGWRLPAARTPRHGDVVVFDWPLDPSKPFVKRLVGLPGDTLSMRDGVLLRNGATVPEPYVAPESASVTLPGDMAPGSADAPPEPRQDWGPVVVPPRHVYVLGDNRARSLDSRYWGFLPDSLVRGTPWFVYYSFEPDTARAAPWLTRIRWDRIGRTVR